MSRARLRVHAPLPPIAVGPTPARLLNAMVIGDGVLFLPLFTTRDAQHLRGVCRELRALRWPESSVPAWDDRSGLRYLDISGYHCLTYSSFRHLVGIRTLNMSCCNVTDTAFAHLVGISHTLDIQWCSQVTITDEAFAHFRGIHTLKIKGCNNRLMLMLP